MEVKTTAKEEAKTQITIEKERTEFKNLIIKNLNYFGTFPGMKIKPVFSMKFNTKYEELGCVGFYPALDLLGAVISVKLPYGYKGNLCSPGSFEYVRFFADWDGDGDFADPNEDLGIESVNVHDIPGGEKVCLEKTKPLSYAITMKIDSKKLKCTIPHLVKVRAILSWDWPPEAGNPSFIPPWGNVVDAWIQIRPGPVLLKDLVEVAHLEKLEFKPAMLDLDLPISKAEALTYSELKEIYSGKDVPEHRFNFPQIYEMVEKIKQDPTLLTQYKLDPATAKVMENIDLVLAEKLNIKYEELRCVGLDYDLDKLVATLKVKLPYGYSGNLCTKGSYEFVAFWAYVWDQIEQMCSWKYLGTASVNVHDIPKIPAEGLQYVVHLPVDLSSMRDKCSKPKVIKIRAILSWHNPPSTNNPNYVPVWGNTAEALVQIRPGIPVNPEEQVPFISVVGGMAVSKISGNSETTIPSAIGDGYANGVNALESPFGRVVSICGHISNAPNISSGATKLNYKVQYRKTADPIWHDITNNFTIYISIWNGTSWSQTHKDQIAVGGYYEYEEDLIPAVLRLIDASDYGGGSVLADWQTLGLPDGLYDTRVLLYHPGAPLVPGVPANHVTSNIIKVVIDNTQPDCGLSLDAGPCEKYTPGSIVTGEFHATDKHIWYYSFHVAPYAPPAGQFTHVPPQEVYPALAAPGVASGTFALDTKNMAPCGYVIYLWVWDRAILNNHLIGNQNGASAGFCLLKEKG